MYVFFFFQAEDGIRDSSVTGVQTCALPIFSRSWEMFCHVALEVPHLGWTKHFPTSGDSVGPALTIVLYRGRNDQPNNAPRNKPLCSPFYRLLKHISLNV